MSSFRPRTLHLIAFSDRAEVGWIIDIRDRGVIPHVFGPLDSPHVQRLVDAGIKVTDVRWLRKIDFDALELIRRVCIDEHIDIVHSGNGRTAQHMVMATRKLHRQGRSPKIVGYVGIIGTMSWWSPISWVRFLNPRIDRIVCVADAIRRHLIEDVRLWGLKLDPDKLVTIHKGHKLEWYREEPGDLSDFGIPEDAMVVTVASRLRPRKGLVELVRALGLTDPARKIHVLLVGHEGNQAIRDAIADLPHPERVHIGGFREDAPRIMAASDVCCLPVLKNEGLSRMLIEGMAYEVCPLVTPVGGNTELVIDGECGLVVPAGDEPALAKAMEWLYDHPEERRRMGRAARERIGTHFRTEDTVEKTLALYKELLSS